MPNNNTTFKDYLHLHLIVFIWGFTAVLGKLISLSALSLVFWRTLLSSLGLLIILKIKPQKVSINSSLAAKYLLIGSVVGLHWITFFGAVKLSNISVCLAGLSTSSLWTSLLEPILLKKRISALDVGMSLIIVLGLYLIFLFEFDKSLGLSVAILSAFFTALFGILNKSLAEHSDPLTMTFYEMIGACLISFVAILVVSLFPTEQIQLQIQFVPTNHDLFWIAVLAFACTIFPYCESMRLLKKFSAFAVSLTLNLEPVYGILLAYLIFGESEHMSGGFYLGALIIFVAVISYPMLKFKAKIKKELKVQ